MPPARAPGLNTVVSPSETCDIPVANWPAKANITPVMSNPRLLTVAIVEDNRIIRQKLESWITEAAMKYRENTLK